MIGDWLAQWPAIVAAFGVIFVPGLAMGFGLRLRGLALWALAPVASTAVVALLAILLAAVGIRWTAASAGIGCLVAIAIAWGIGFALGPRRAQPTRHRLDLWLLAAGLSVGIVIGALRVGFYIGDPTAISQTNDAVFHLNALRHILETGSASSMDISSVIGARGFYPGAWHGLVSLALLFSGASIPVATTAVTLIISVVVWPLGVTWLARVASGGSIPTAALAAALSPMLLAFPLLMLEWGVLYPYGLSVAILPSAVGAVVVAPRWIAGRGPVDGTIRAVVLCSLLVLASLGAIALAQPSTLLAWAIMAVSFFLWWAGSRLRKSTPRTRRWLVAMMGIVTAAFALFWVTLNGSTTGGTHWPPFRSRVLVLADVLTNMQVMLPAAWGVSILMVIGLVVAVRRPSLRWIATSWVVLSGLYVVSASIGSPWLRNLLIGAWYGDPYRFAALTTVVVIPLAAIGAVAVIGWASRILSDRAPREAAAVATAWAILAIAVVGVVGLAVKPVVQMPKVIEDEYDTQSRYAIDDESYLSLDERALIERLDQHVPEDALILGNPSTGTGFAYALGGRNVYPRTWAAPRSPQFEVLSDHLRDAADDPEVCDSLRLYGGASYVLDFGPGEASPGRYIRPGMTDFAGQQGFELVDREGDASLWRITACG